MKILDAEHLHKGIDNIKNEIPDFQNQISGVQQAVNGIVSLNDTLKGEGGEAIRTFYEQCHQPFLIYMQHFLTDYEELFDQVKEAVLSFEPNEKAMIREEFLEDDVTSGLEKVEDVTVNLTDEANAIMDSIRDIVALPKMDDEEFLHNVQRGKKKTKETVEGLYDLDDSQTSALESVEKQLETMKGYITDIQAVFTNGEISLQNMDGYTAEGMGFYRNTLVDKPAEFTALQKQNQFNRGAWPFVAMMYPNMMFPITYRNHGKYINNVTPKDISEQRFIQELAEQNRMTDEEAIQIQQYLQKISGEEVTTTGVGIAPHSSYNQELAQKEKEIEDLQKMINSYQASASQGERENYAREPITFEDKRKVMGGNSDLAGDPYMMGHIASAGFDFAFDDIETIVDPDATAADKMMAGLFLGVKPAKLVGKSAEAFKAGEKVKDVGEANKSISNSLLPSEGKVDTFKQLTKQGTAFDNITPHHMPSAKKMKQAGIKRNNGVGMNMEQPHPGVGGRHRETYTYGLNGKKLEEYLNLTYRDALAHDILDARRIYMNEGLYTPQIRNGLSEVIRKNNELYPDLFKK
ncbi:ribonuclease YeeF family protein [Virgibacillus dakarensis]|uniref:ribonuclease YeeF family protein n=1 Tax=Virgibacillus dakarensis TaxID=1917889 RepID=UPI0013566B6E|nr:LXG domain-containing protein [Virgibacillus dakarensis]